MYTQCRIYHFIASTLNLICYSCTSYETIIFECMYLEVYILLLLTFFFITRNIVTHNINSSLRKKKFKNIELFESVTSKALDLQLCLG